MLNKNFKAMTQEEWWDMFGGIIQDIDAERRTIWSFSNNPNYYNDIKKHCFKLIRIINKFWKLHNLADKERHNETK